MPAENTLGARALRLLQDAANYLADSVTGEGFLYVKESLGKDGDPVDIFKLRTMLSGPEPVMQYDSHGKPIDDPRVTPFCAFLRTSWLDEIPQLWNLARRDLKLVGVRPMREVDWRRYPNELKQRALAFEPGLLGFQYAHRRTDRFEDHVRDMDAYLRGCEQDLPGTDRRYLGLIARNIARGQRSS